MTDPIQQSVKEAVAETKATGVETAPSTAAAHPAQTSAAIRAELVVQRFWISSRYTLATIAVTLFASMTAAGALASPHASAAWLQQFWWPFAIGQVVAPALRAFAASREQPSPTVGTIAETIK